MDIVIAGGIESMTRVPMGMPVVLPRKSGLGFYMSPALLNKYKGVEFSQFTGAEILVKKYNLTKEDVDKFSLQSHQKAFSATQSGFFKDEILPLEVRTYDPKTGAVTNPSGVFHTIDEGIRSDVSIEGMAKVKPMAENGLLTAANASQICDGASGVMVVNERGLRLLNVKPLARIHNMTMFGHDPVVMLEAPLQGTDRALQRAGLKINDIDLFEINEAFASVPLAWLQHTGADPAKLNVYGGAIALGHPLGASGTKLMTTLVHALIREKKRWGLQSMCEGGGKRFFYYSTTRELLLH
jgi:acetyl-CoA C-acetyltransferase